jgi:hypothetical protein
VQLCCVYFVVHFGAPAAAAAAAAAPCCAVRFSASWCCWLVLLGRQEARQAQLSRPVS